MKGWTRRTGARNKDAVKEGAKKRILIKKIVVLGAVPIIFLTWLFLVHESLHLLVCKIATGDGTISWSIPSFTSCPDLIGASAPVYFLGVMIPYIVDFLLVSTIFLISRKEHPIITLFASLPLLNTLYNYISTINDQFTDFGQIFKLGLGWYVMSIILVMATGIIGVLTLLRLVPLLKRAFQKPSTSQKGH